MRVGTVMKDTKEGSPKGGIPLVVTEVNTLLEDGVEGVWLAMLVCRKLVLRFFVPAEDLPRYQLVWEEEREKADADCL